MCGAMNEGAKQKLSKLIRTLRGGSTQKEFAQKLGVTYGAIQSWEKAEVDNPSSASLIKIGNYMGVTLQQLLEQLNDKPSSDTTPNPMYVVSQLGSMSIKDLTHLYKAVSDRLVAIAESAGR